MNYKRYKKYIVVDEEHRPMTFQEDGKHSQFCSCDTDRASRPFAVQLYTLKEARKLIERSLKFRQEELGDYTTEYHLMPVNPKIQ